MADTPISSDPTLTGAQIADGDLVPLVDVSEPAASDKNKNTSFTHLTTYFQTNLDFAASTHTHPWSEVTATPTTLSGYGITDAAPSSHLGGNIHIDWTVTGGEVIHADRYTDTIYSHPATHPWSMITSTPTTISGYGITDAVPSSHLGGDIHIDWSSDGGTSTDFGTVGTVYGGYFVPSIGGVHKSSNTAYLSLSGSTGENAGANLRLYGEAATGLQYDVEFRSATTIELKFDASGNSWNFQGNAITTTGDVTGNNLNVSDWDTAFGWGDHSGLYAPSSHVGGNIHIDWTIDQGATNIHAGNYTNTTYTAGDFNHDDLANVPANDHIDWTIDQGATNIHAGNYTNTVYSLPLATATVRGGIELYSNTDNPTAANAVTSTASRTYGLQLNAANQGVINVPWTDTVYSHPTHPGDDFSVDTGVLSGATVVSDIDINVTTDTLGHVTDANGAISTRTLTLANLGYTGDTNANNYSHPNHSGDVTSVGDGAQTIANNAVTNAKAADVGAYTIKMRNAGTTGDPQDVKISALTATLPLTGWLLGETSGGALYKVSATGFQATLPLTGDDGDVLTWSDGTGEWVASPPAGGGGLTWSVRTTSGTVTAGTGTISNISSGTITLPATLAVGDEIVINNIHSTTLTVADNGKTIRYKGTSYTANVTLDQGETIHLVASSTAIWEIV